MNQTTLRILILLAFALAATLILINYLGESSLGGTFAGFDINIVGPAALLILLLIIFWKAKLFQIGLNTDSDKVVIRQIEKMTLEEIEDSLEIVSVRISRLNRDKKRLENALQALDNNESNEAVLAASGFSPVRRPT